jgi:hypothetical protein
VGLGEAASKFDEILYVLQRLRKLDNSTATIARNIIIKLGQAFI